MRGLVFLILILLFGGILLSGASWALATNTVSEVLGAPPPRMGRGHTAFAFGGARALRGHPRVWVFSYGPTAIPGAPNVRLYVGPTGRLLRTEPADLAQRLKVFHATGYN